jgi:hypothetical protein
MLRIALVLIALVSTVDAQSVRKVEVAVDATVEVPVGNLIGVACDAPKLLDAQMKTKKDKGAEYNVLSVKGLTTGTTLCRVGNELTGGTQLFEVTVVEKKR